MLKTLTSTVARRFREPSSWGGIAILLGMFGMSQDQAGAVTELLAAGAAVASVFLSEPGASA